MQLRIPIRGRKEEEGKKKERSVSRDIKGKKMNKVRRENEVATEYMYVPFLVRSHAYCLYRTCQFELGREGQRRRTGGGRGEDGRRLGGWGKKEGQEKKREAPKDTDRDRIIDSGADVLIKRPAKF